MTPYLNLRVMFKISCFQMIGSTPLDMSKPRYKHVIFLNVSGMLICFKYILLKCGECVNKRVF